MITYILEININGKLAKKWRSWNVNVLIKKVNELKMEIPPYVRGFASPNLEPRIRYHIGKLTTGEINIKLYEDKSKFTHIYCVINNRGDIIKDETHYH